MLFERARTFVPLVALALLAGSCRGGGSTASPTPTDADGSDGPASESPSEEPSSEAPSEEPSSEVPSESDAPAGDRATWIQEADALCAASDQETGPLFGAVFGEQGPDLEAAVENLPQITELQAALVEDILALPKPSGDETTIDQIAGRVENGIGALERATEAARGDDREAFSRALNEALVLFEQANFQSAEFGLEACASDAAQLDYEPAAGATVVEVAATEMAFETVGTTPAGATAFSLRNDGAVMHELVILKLKEGATAQDVADAESEAAARELVESEVGGTYAPPEFGSVFNTDELAPGSYGLFCFIPSEDGAPHAALGMASDLVVE